MKTRIVLYGENDKPISILGDNPQEKVKKAWDAVIALLAVNTDDIIRVESVEVWDTEADTSQTDLLVTKYPQNGEINLIGRDKTEAVVMAYDVYKKLTEPQTDNDFTLLYTCSFRNCENFKNFGFSEECIKCKQKQSEVIWKTEPQTKGSE